MTDKSAIVTGASSFVGQYLLRELLDAGYHVLGLTHNAQLFEGALGEVLYSYYQSGNLAVERFDLDRMELSEEYRVY